MDRINELKAELAQIEQDRKQEALQQHLADMKKVVGKGWCTHAISTYMTRGRGAYEFHAYYVDDAIIRDKEAVFLYRLVSIYKGPETFRFHTQFVNYQTQLPDYIGTFRYEIDEANFNKIYEEAVAAVEVGIDHIRNTQPIGYKVSNGDHRDMESARKWLDGDKEMYKFIDLSKEEPMAFQLLKYKHHPFLYNTHLINSEESLRIAKKIADSVYRDALRWGGSVLERDKPRVESLNRFISKYSKS